jgi:hypothetical protein
MGDGVDGFAEVLKSLGDPDIAASAGAPPLSDIKTLASDSGSRRQVDAAASAGSEGGGRSRFAR